LNFVEFNYQLLQAYDFLYLSEHYDCILQMGGNDQWGNIVAGIDLIRRKGGKSSYGITFPLLTTASGAKMGKTAAGAVWLSAAKTSPFDFYQYWVNTEDQDVVRFLRLYTFLPLAEIAVVESLAGQDLNACKTILAFEVTALTHGFEEAVAAFEGASQIFGQRHLPADLLPSSPVPRRIGDDGAVIPTTVMSRQRLESGIPAFELFAEIGLCSSKSAARRLIQQGGAYANQERIQTFDEMIGSDFLTAVGIVLRAGKKKVHRIRIEG